ncbi:unknown [Clostridium sp. CAG:628]|nr:unknown [Clostridium sp. CAG:628]
MHLMICQKVVNYLLTYLCDNAKISTINSADLKIIFTDSDGSISGTNIEPGKWNVTKTFTIENKSNETYKYNIVIQNLVNTFVTNGYLQYKITSTNGGYNMTGFKDVPKSSAPKDKILAYSVSIPVGVTQSYTVEFKYANDESVDQSIDMGKKLSGTLFITEGTEEILEVITIMVQMTLQPL